MPMIKARGGQVINAFVSVVLFAPSPPWSCL
jgi:hypothetical protein